MSGCGGCDTRITSKADRMRIEDILIVLAGVVLCIVGVVVVVRLLF
jgi:hypothetical protein